MAQACEIDEDEEVKPGARTSGSLRAEVEGIGDGWLKVLLAGSIDENADLDGLFGKLGADAVMNMRGVDRVNSMGVHRWIPLVTKFTTQHRLVIDEISYALVQNANVVANLFGGAMLRSCMAPYFCARCKDNCTVLVTADEVAQAGSEPPVKHCGRCNSPMEFDELDGYFGFYKRSRR